MRYSAPLLELCALALAQVASFKQPADVVLSHFFRGHGEAGKQDRALIAETVYAALRRWRLLQAIAPDSSFRQLALATWITQLQALPGDIAFLQRDEMAWAAGIEAKARAEQPFEVQCDLPDW